MKKLKMRLVFISLLFIPLYLFRLSQVSEYKIPENQPVKIIGRITQQPYLKDSYQIIYLGPILLTTSRFPGYFYGEKIQVIGKFQKRVTNPFQTQYFTSFPAIQKIEEKEREIKKFDLRQFLWKTRGQIEESLTSFLPEPEGSLLLGILFGIKKQMPENFWQNLRKTGTLHIVVASGQNVTMVASFLIEILVMLINRRKAIFLAIIGVALYVLMVGAEAPVIRAGIMIGFAYLAQIFGREGEAGVGLVFAGIAMLLVSPLILFDIGFQLSFAAMAGIIFFYPLLKPKLRIMPILGEGLATTLSAQIATLPILLLNFGQFSWLSPLINALVLPTIPFIMALGGAASGLSLVSKSLALVLSWFVLPFLAWFVKVIEFAGRLPWVSLEVGKLSAWWALGYYLLLVLLLARYSKSQLR